MSRVQSHNGVGASTIILIIVVLSLTTFGVLTLVSARNDQMLTRRTAESAEAYYTADAAAQQTLLSIDEALLAGKFPDSVPGVTSVVGETDAYTFSCETGDGRALSVVIRCDGRKRPCVVTEYRLVQLTEWKRQQEFLYIPESK